MGPGFASSRTRRPSSSSSAGWLRWSGTSEDVMPDLSRAKLKAYLETLHRAPVEVIGLARLGEPLETAELKGYGYGSPLRVEYELAGRHRSAVIETVSPGPFGHEHMSDRAQILLWDHRAFNSLPGHVRSLDVGGFRASGELVS